MRESAGGRIVGNSGRIEPNRSRHTPCAVPRCTPHTPCAGRHTACAAYIGQTAHGVCLLRCGDARLDGGLRHGLGHAGRHALVEHAGNDVVGAKFALGNHFGDGLGGGDLHRFRHPPGADVEHARETGPGNRARC